MLIPLGLVLAFVLIVLLRSNRSRECRWREDRSAASGREKHFVCVACGAKAVTRTGGQPDHCLKP